MADGKTLFKWGCLGCLGLIGLVVFVVAVLVGLVWTDVQNEVPRTAEATPEPAAIVDATADGAGAVRIVLDVDASAEVHIEPVEAGQALRAEATYDERSYAFEQSRETTAEGGLIWNIGFRSTSRLPFAGLRALFGGTRSRLRVEIPRDVPFTLEGVVRNGSLQGDVGGTHLRSLEMETSRGAFILQISEPLAEPMERFVIEANQGANIVQQLGNASPREVRIGCSMGACVIDLGGSWRNDATLELDAAMSGAVLSLSEEVVYEGLEDVKGFAGSGFRTAGAEAEVPLPTLRCTVDGKWEIQ